MYFRRQGNAISFVDKLVKSCKFPPGESIQECISKYLFPNFSGVKQKARFLGLELAGELLERELRVHIRHAERRMVKAMQRELYGDRDLRPIENYLDASIITNGLSRAFSTGQWSHPFKRMERISGVVATLRRTNPLQMTADMRKTRQQVQYTGKVGMPDTRKHPSHWGKVCFLSTPDGENCGLVKNLAITGLVSTEVLDPLVDKLFDCGMEKLVDDTSTKLSGKNKVFLDGDWVGVCEDPISFVVELRTKRRHKELPQQVRSFLMHYEGFSDSQSSFFYPHTNFANVVM
ncbi:DNA-directed RNA polymerases IV and V subunit 2 [Vitis vinifera]|uniref:DNA-directed RNA polymerase n=1 Tax=Vitis vinifera TaxID=29760 RepID=A0A438KEK2_VITVI|nr:DNA-directed RNA polymerases IV and V subunit 2 [Vitis vinifera]